MAHTTPRQTWLAVVRVLTTRLQSMTLATRGKHARRIRGSTRASTWWTPHLTVVNRGHFGPTVLRPSD